MSFFLSLSNFLLLLTLQANYNGVLLDCCTTGETYAEKANNCKGFKPPTVPSELIGACLFSAEICCNSKLRIEQCKQGVQAAKGGVDCHGSGNETATEFYKACCEACKVGLIIGAMTEECSTEVLYGTPFDDSYNYCCNEMKAGDSFTLSEGDSKWNWVDPSQSVILNGHIFICRYLHQIR